MSKFKYLKNFNSRVSAQSVAASLASSWRGGENLQIYLAQPLSFKARGGRERRDSTRKFRDVLFSLLRSKIHSRVDIAICTCVTYARSAKLSCRPVENPYPRDTTESGGLTSRKTIVCFRN